MWATHGATVDLSFLADVQYADIPDRKGALGALRHYRWSLNIVNKAVDAWSEEEGEERFHALSPYPSKQIRRFLCCLGPLWPYSPSSEGQLSR